MEYEQTVKETTDNSKEQAGLNTVSKRGHRLDELIAAALSPFKPRKKPKRIPTFDTLKFNHGSEALGTKLHIFHYSIVSQFPVET